MDFDENRNRVYLLHLENGERLGVFYNFFGQQYSYQKKCVKKA
jgi:hypothetical protein